MGLPTLVGSTPKRHAWGILGDRVQGRADDLRMEDEASGGSCLDLGLEQPGPWTVS